MTLGIKFLIGLMMIGGLAMVGAAGYYGFASNQPQQQETIEAPPTVNVERGDVDLTVTAPGSLVASGKQVVRSEINGQLTNINVQAGDTVQAGQTIATIDTAPLEEALKQAQQAVVDAQDGIASGITGAQSGVTSAEEALLLLQLEYPTKDRIQLALEQARAALTDAQSALSRINTRVANALTKYESAKTALSTANTELSAAKTTRDATKQALTDAKSVQTTAQNAHNAALTAQAKAQKDYDDAVMNGAPQPDITQLKTVLDNTIAATASAQTILDTATSKVITGQTNYDTAESAYQTEVQQQAQAQVNADQAQSEYEQAIVAAEQAQTMLRNAEFSVRQLELDLRDVEKQQQLADRRLEAAQRAVDQAKANLETARARTLDPELQEAVVKAQEALDAAVITAPINGQVLQVHHAAGEYVQPGEQIITITNPSLLEIYATVIEEDLPLVRVGQPVDLFFDAAPDAEISGRIDRIVPERVSGADRPLYAVYITIEGALPAGLLPGMNAEGSIIIEQRTDVLTLPRAVVRARSDGTALIEVWNGSTIESRTVKVGLRGDVYVEILEGLSEGDQVVAE